MDREPNQRTLYPIFKFNGINQARSPNIFYNSASVIIFVPTAFYCAINHNNRETVQIVEPNNNTVHQQPYQPDQSAGQSLQFNQLDQPLMNNPGNN